MDNLTHSLVGLMMSRAGLRRFSPGATAILILASNAPDVDVVSAAGGSLNYLHYHRGLTHAIPFAPVLAALPVLLVGLLIWKGNRQEWKKYWKGAYLISLLAILGHILLDWTNTYGVRLLEPFSSRWYHADITFIVDVWILAALLLAVAGSFLSRLLSSEMGGRRGKGSGAARFALVFYLVYSLFRWNLHDRAVETLSSRLYEGTEPVRVAAFPTLVNPFLWTGLVEGADSYAINHLNLRADYDPDASHVYYKPGQAPAIEAARKTEVFRAFLRFSQFPLWSVSPAPNTPGGTQVEVVDLRFGTPSQPRFVAEALLDKNLQIVSSGFSFGAPATRSR